MIFLDEDDSIKYRIQHVSNGGKRKFYVNPTSGTSTSQYIMYNVQTYIQIVHMNANTVLKKIMVISLPWNWTQTSVFSSHNLFSLCVVGTVEALSTCILACWGRGGGGSNDIKKRGHLSLFFFQYVQIS